MAVMSFSGGNGERRYRNGVDEPLEQRVLEQRVLEKSLPEFPAVIVNCDYFLNKYSVPAISSEGITGS